ncbi:MAG: hypothetical protein IJB48_05760 [Clostridia bacterium]|nr:hypothetical protein [Clostridia bacterium]MBQ4143018.1 hypothetical protein [Thermoguttaceae bacterium]
MCPSLAYYETQYYEQDSYYETDVVCNRCGECYESENCYPRDEDGYESEAEEKGWVFGDHAVICVDCCNALYDKHYDEPSIWTEKDEEDFDNCRGDYAPDDAQPALTQECTEKD